MFRFQTVVCYEIFDVGEDYRIEEERKIPGIQSLCEKFNNMGTRFAKDYQFVKFKGNITFPVAGEIERRSCECSHSFLLHTFFLRG